MTTTTADWVAGARPRTLTTAVAPVAVGTAAASQVGDVTFLPAILALGVALALQVAVNYANDYSDGVRGTDVDRIGPERLVASGKASPSSVKMAAFAFFGIGALLGLWLVLVAGPWWLLIVGVVAIAAAWTYTGSSRPYGYAGYGEISVFFFFGPVAVLGTMLTQVGRVTWWAVVASAAVGLYAVAMLLVNNIRDRERDEIAGKRTLAVKVGDARARQLFTGAMLLPVGLTVLIAFAHPWALLATIVALPALLLSIAVRVGAESQMIGRIFSGVSMVGLVYGIALSVGLLI